MRNDIDPENLGKVFILPSAFIASPGYMDKRMQDAMTYMHHFGRTDLFVNFTYNPKWSEITRELLPGQRTSDRHVLIARVFQLKMTLLTRLIHIGKAFGDIRAYVYTVEGQKKGLPHIHHLIWLLNKTNVTDIDSLISAELLDPNVDKDRYDIVTAHMFHGPCRRGAVNEIHNLFYEKPRQAPTATHFHRLFCSMLLSPAQPTAL